MNRPEYIVGHSYYDVPPKLDLFFEDGRYYQTELKSLPIIYRIKSDAFGLFVDELYFAFKYDKELKEVFSKMHSDNREILSLELTIKTPITQIIDCKQGLLVKNNWFGTLSYVSGWVW